MFLFTDSDSPHPRQSPESPNERAEKKKRGRFGRAFNRTSQPNAKPQQVQGGRPDARRGITEDVLVHRERATRSQIFSSKSLPSTYTVKAKSGPGNDCQQKGPARSSLSSKPKKKSQTKRSQERGEEGERNNPLREEKYVPGSGIGKREEKRSNPRGRNPTLREKRTKHTGPLEKQEKS